MIQILKADIVLQEVEHDLTEEEIMKAEGSAVFTDKGWVIIKDNGKCFLMHVIANIKPGSGDWVYDNAKGLVKVRMMDNIPMSVGNVKITKENIEIISQLPGFENSELKIGNEIEIKNDLSNTPVALRTTRRSRSSSNSFPGTIGVDFIAKFIDSGFNIKHVMVHVKSDRTEILWDSSL